MRRFKIRAIQWAQIIHMRGGFYDISRDMAKTSGIQHSCRHPNKEPNRELNAEAALTCD
jgi:hypothetical protein